MRTIFHITLSTLLMTFLNANDSYTFKINQNEYSFLLSILSLKEDNKNFVYTINTKYVFNENLYYLTFSADIQLIDKLKKTLLQYKINMDKMESVKKYNPYKNIRYRNEIKQIIHSHNNMKIKKIISKLENINLQDKESYTPIYYAIDANDISTLELLIKKGANINAYTLNNVTPLHYAVKKGSFKIVQYLIEQGALINVQDSRGKTPLHIASGEHNREIIDYLIRKGANKNIRDYNGLLPQF